MRINPRPIPLAYQGIIDLSEDILAKFEQWLLSFKGTPCYNVSFLDWRYPRYGCYDEFLKQGDRTILFIPIGITATDVTGKTYAINEIGLELIADAWASELFYGASWTSQKKNFAKNKAKLGENLNSLRKDIHEIEDMLSEFDLNNLLPDEEEDIAAVIINIQEMKEDERKLSDTVKVLDITQRDGGFITIGTHIGFSPREVLMDLESPKYRKASLHSLQEMLVHEMTHLHDPQLSKKIDYYNDPHEIRAEMQRIIFLLWRDLIYEKSVNWDTDLKPRFTTQPFDEVFLPYLDSKGEFNESFWDKYSERNKAKIRSAVLQWLQENGFDLPKRRF